MPVYHQYKLVFVHIPKTAGTSVEHVLGSCELLASVKNYERGVCPQHYYLSEILELYPNISSFRRFTIVRNPFDRLVSAYHNNLKFYWSKGLSFDEFVEKGLNLDYKSRRFIFDGHLDPQVKYLDANLSVSIFKFERLHVLTEYLSKAINRLVFLPKINDSIRKETISYYNQGSTVDLVRKFYQEDFENFVYEVDPPA